MEQHPPRLKRWQIEHNKRKVPLREALALKYQELRMIIHGLLGLVGLNKTPQEETETQIIHTRPAPEARFRPVSYGHKREHRRRRPPNHH